ncbi:MAG: DUF4835 family protein [Cyclobacteriaceae bacterium]
MKYYLIVFILFYSLASSAQELLCKVTVNAQQIQITERSIFSEMEIAMSDFMNNTKWTNDEFKEEEKINCNIILNLDPEQSDPLSGRYSASVQIISSRPIFNTDYQSILLNFGDTDWVFEYLPSQPIFFNENAFTSNLSSLLSFYAFIILGLDYDSFADKGGDSYFQKAFQVMNLAQQQGYTGWDQFNSIRNRYWLIENILHPQMQPLREVYYQYHIQGMDTFAEGQDEARETIYSSLKKVLNVNQSRPRAIYTISFLDAKSTELQKIYEEGDPALRRNVYNLLVNIDPTKRSEFNSMIK